MRSTRPVLCLMALLNSACVAALYDGPPRPDSDVATVVPTETQVVRIDDREAAAPPTHAEAAVPRIEGGEEPPSSKRPERLRPLRPGSGVGFEMGGAFGGARLVTATLDDGTVENIAAGKGFVSSVTGSWMPLWLTNAVGFGGAVSAGIKYSNIGGDNGVIRLSRFPVSVSLQSLLRLDRNWFLLARAGALKELRIRLRGDGIASEVDVTMTSQGGRLVEGGLYYAPGHNGALACSVRRTWLHYQLGGRSLDASSVTIAGSLHLNF